MGNTSSPRRSQFDTDPVGHGGGRSCELTAPGPLGSSDAPHVLYDGDVPHGVCQADHGRKRTEEPLLRPEKLPAFIKDATSTGPISTPPGLPAQAAVPGPRRTLSPRRKERPRFEPGRQQPRRWVTFIELNSDLDHDPYGKDERPIASASSTQGDEPGAGQHGFHHISTSLRE